MVNGDLMFETWNHEKTTGDLMFSGGIERDQWWILDHFRLSLLSVSFELRAS